MKTRAVCLVTVLLVGGHTAAQEQFEPRVEKVVPLVKTAVDLELMTAGRPQSRFQRARKLMAGLKPIDKLEVLKDSNVLLNWIAALAMVESAVRDAGKVEAEWEGQLLDLYRHLAAGEDSYQVIERLAAVWTLQPGGEQHLLVKMGRQLAALAGYCRRGVRWLAGRHLKDEEAKTVFRRQLLEALVQVERRDGNWRQMYRAALSLCDMQAAVDCQAWQAEALYELGQGNEADKLLARLPATEVVEAARLRRQVYRQHDAVARGDVSGMMALVKALLELGESRRVGTLVPPARVVAVADAGLDEVYMDAIFRDGLDFRGAWSFGSRARGRPARPGLLSRRIAAGLMKLMESFYHQPGRQLDGRVLGRVQSDLVAFRPANPLLADLTGLNLALMNFALAGAKNQAELAAIGKRILQFRRSYPRELAGVQMLFLVAQLGGQVADTFAEVSAWKSSGGDSLPARAVPLVGGAALRQLLVKGSTKAIDQVLGWLEKAGPARGSNALWMAHLRAARGLVAAEAGRQQALQQAVDAYGTFIKSLESSGAGDEQALVELCDGLTSLATLVMQGGQPAQGLQLIDQAASVCQRFGATAAARAVMAMTVARDDKSSREAVGRLAASLPQIESRQARAQAYLWLALTMAAAGEEKAARESAQKAMALMEEGRKLGTPVYLAPDLRSMIGFSGSFDINMGYSSASPFGLEIDVGIRCRAPLFPPAAVDEKRLQQLLGRARGP